MTTSLRLLASALVILVVGTIIVFMFNRDKIKKQVIMDKEQNNLQSQIPPLEDPKTYPQQGLSDIEFPEANKPPYFYVPVGGDWVEINKNWSIRLAEIISDTRCPIGTKCATAGPAKVKIQLMQSGADYHKAYFEELEVLGNNRFQVQNGKLRLDENLSLRLDLMKFVKVSGTNAVTREDIGFNIALADLKPYPRVGSVTDLADKSWLGLFYVQD